MSNCIINVANGYWYPKGQKRLVESLRDTGYAGDILTWTNEPINAHYDPAYPYTAKVAAWIEAFRKGYTNVLWLDCSVYAIKDVTPFMERNREEGCFFWRSGWNLAQTATDEDLIHGGFTRDQAEGLPECASGIVALNLEKAFARRILYDVFEFAKKGVLHSSRLHDNQSQDPRFKFARQDQTAFTMAYHRSIKPAFDPMHEAGEYCDWYKKEGHNDSVCLVIKGM